MKKVFTVDISLRTKVVADIDDKCTDTNPETNDGLWDEIADKAQDKVGDNIWEYLAPESITKIEEDTDAEAAVIEKLKSASEKIRQSRDKFYNAEMEARETLMDVLKPCGEHGVSIAPLDCIEDTYESIAEHEPHEFSPITLIRYWEGKLEVFISDYKVCDDGSWTILPEGQWIDYVKAHTDTWFMLDQVWENLEWADGYQVTE